MYKRARGFIRGMGTGIVAGAAVFLVGNRMMKKNKHLRRNANKVRHAVNGLLYDVEVVFKH